MPANITSSSLINSAIDKHKQLSKDNNKKQIIASAAGLAVGTIPNAYILYDTFAPLKENDIKDLQDFMGKKILPKIETFEKTNDVAQKILKDTGLDSKGVKLIVADGTVESNKALDVAFKNIKPKRLAEKFKTMMREGCNACFINNSNSVVIENKTLYESVYHEIGHAMNHNTNIFTKMLQKSRAITPYGFSMVAPIALGIAMFHKINKTKPKEQKSVKEKSLDFIANNAGKLTLASYIPLLAEEGLASIRGLKAAKKYLNPNHIAKLKGNYFKAWGTYAITALIAAGGVGLGSIVKDKIASKKANAAA